MAKKKAAEREAASPAAVAAVQDGVAAPAAAAAVQGAATPVAAAAVPAEQDDEAAATPAKGSGKGNRWNAEREERFIEHLTLTSNVTASCGVAGMSVNSAYQRRKTHPEFREGWDVAMDDGCLRLKAEVLDEALNGVRSTTTVNGEPQEVITPVPIRTKLALLALHGRRSAERVERAANVAEVSAARKSELRKFSELLTRFGYAP